MQVGRAPGRRSDRSPGRVRPPGAPDFAQQPSAGHWPTSPRERPPQRPRSRAFITSPSTAAGREGLVTLGGSPGPEASDPTYTAFCDEPDWLTWGSTVLATAVGRPLTSGRSPLPGPSEGGPDRRPTSQSRIRPLSWAALRLRPVGRYRRNCRRTFLGHRADTVHEGSRHLPLVSGSRFARLVSLRCRHERRDLVVITSIEACEADARLPWPVDCCHAVIRTSAETPHDPHVDHRGRVVAAPGRHGRQSGYHAVPELTRTARVVPGARATHQQGHLFLRTRVAGGSRDRAGPPKANGQRTWPVMSPIFSFSSCPGVGASKR